MSSSWTSTKSGSGFRILELEYDDTRIIFVLGSPMRVLLSPTTGDMHLDGVVVVLRVHLDQNQVGVKGISGSGYEESRGLCVLLTG